ncbi:peptidylprolyl isomerase [uncultured Hyphomicrobium sp.]|uniref:peptidylprolyl isomerase n=1 Tax=uncultured Hyphomicrobium sp. TaxID=194373 RepID=UPI0025E80356|nr:peptidylprolyl isomerase [uncultured Hyphomicrobium sp.]
MTAIVINHAAKRTSAPTNSHEHRPAPRKTTPSPEPVAMPVVSVNGVAIPRKAIAAEVQNFPARNPGEGWRAAARALVIRELLLQEARRLEIVAEQKTDKDGRKETIEDALVRSLVEREVRVPVADDEALQRFYYNNRCRFVTPTLYEADHILIPARLDEVLSLDGAREKATTLANVLARRPELFASLAREHSACPSGKLGGSLGQIAPGETTPEFEAALAKLGPGTISASVETRYGVHLIRLLRRIEGQPLPFEAVRDRIKHYLEEHVRRQATAQYIAVLIGRADIRGISLTGAETPLVQ